MNFIKLCAAVAASIMGVHAQYLHERKIITKYEIASIRDAKVESNRHLEGKGASQTPCTDTTNVYLNNRPRTCITSGGIPRCWWTYVPNAVATSNDDGLKIPLVIDMHGGGGCASPSSGWEALADSFTNPSESFVTVYPQGSNRLWGSCGSDCSSTEANAGAAEKGINSLHSVDDISFLEELIANMVAGGRIDPERVYLTGFSMGCMMAHRFAMERSHLVAGLGCHGGDLNLVNTNIPSEMDAIKTRFNILPMPVYNTIGTLDTIYHPRALGDFDTWAYWNGCSKSIMQEVTLQSPAGDGQEDKRSGCIAFSPDLETIMLEVSGEGHSPDQRMALRVWEHLHKYKRAGVRGLLPDAVAEIQPPVVDVANEGVDVKPRNEKTTGTANKKGKSEDKEYDMDQHDKTKDRNAVLKSSNKREGENVEGKIGYSHKIPGEKDHKGDDLKQHDKSEDKTADTDSEELKDTKHMDKHGASGSEKHNEDGEEEQKETSESEPKLEFESASTKDGSKKMKGGKGADLKHDDDAKKQNREGADLKQHDKSEDKTADTDSEELKDTKHTDKHGASGSEKHNEDGEEEEKSEPKLESESAKAQDGIKKMKDRKGADLKQHDKSEEKSAAAESKQIEDNDLQHEKYDDHVTAIKGHYQKNENLLPVLEEEDATRVTTVDTVVEGLIHAETTDSANTKGDKDHNDIGYMSAGTNNLRVASSAQNNVKVSWICTILAFGFAWSAVTKS